MAWNAKKLERMIKRKKGAAPLVPGRSAANATDCQPEAPVHEIVFMPTKITIRGRIEAIKNVTNGLRARSLFPFRASE